MKIHCKFDKMVPIAELKLAFNKDNPNKHPDDQIDILGQIFNYQGIRREAVISKQSKLLTQGHGRILAAEELGLKEYPVTYQDYDNLEMEYADMVADNSLNQRSILDFSAINLKLEDLGPDFNIDFLGLKNFLIEPMENFKEKEIDESLETTKTCPSCGYQF